MVEIPPSPGGNLSTQPDTDTAKAETLDPTTSGAVPDRVIYINLGFIKFGTRDQAYAASLILSLILLIMIGFVIRWGANATNKEWADRVFSWLGGAFLFIVGVAIGKGTKEPDA